MRRAALVAARAATRTPPRRQQHAAALRPRQAPPPQTRPFVSFLRTRRLKALERAADAAPAADEPFDEAAATKECKKLTVPKLRAALEAAGADTKGLKAALVERLVGVKRAAAAQKG